MKRYTIIFGIMLMVWMAALAMVMSPPATTQAQNAPDAAVNGLFVPYAGDDTALDAATSQDIPTIRQRLVRLNADALNTPNATISLNLFDDVQVMATSVQTQPHTLIQGGTVYVGRVQNDEFSNVILATGDGHLSGFIAQGERIYQVRSLGADGVHVVQQVDAAYFYSDAEHAFPVDAPQESRVLPALLDKLTGTQNLFDVAQNGQDAGDTVIDLLVAYSADARSASGGTSNILNNIQVAISLANQAFVDSQMDIEINVVHTVEVSYPGSFTAAQALQHLGALNDGYLDNLHTLRNQYGADLITLITNISNSTGPDAVCGASYILGDLTWDFYAENAAYNVVQTNCLLSSAPAHHIGHNLGFQHNIEDGPPRDQAIFDYAYGYRDPGFLRTIMSFACSEDGLSPCPTIYRYSNRVTLYNGRAVGNSLADNRTVGQQTAPIVAYYRTCTTDGTYNVPANDTDALLLALTTASRDFCFTGNKTISLASNSTYTFNEAVTSFNGDSALPTIAQDIIMQGNGSTLRLRNGNGGTPDYRFVYVDFNGDLTLRNLTIDGGAATGNGGILSNFDTLILENVTIKNGTASNFGGLIYNAGELIITDSDLLNGAAVLSGGQIYNGGTTTITNSTLTNDAQQALESVAATSPVADRGGLIYNAGLVNIDGSSLSEGLVSVAGGLIYNYQSTLNIEDSTLSYGTVNNATLGGGAIYNFAGTVNLTRTDLTHNTTTGSGGAINNTDNGTVTITDGTLAHNTADVQAGAIINTDTLTINGTVFSENASDFNGGAIVSNDTLALTAATFSKNTAGEDGGALYTEQNVTINTTIFDDNTSGDWGGAALFNIGTVSIADSTFSNNQTLGDGYGGGFGATGTGTYPSYTLKLTVNGTTFSGNTAINDANALGGAMALYKVDANFTNSTISGNEAGFGGGLMDWDSDTLLVHTTIANNVAANAYDLYNYQSNTRVRGVIFASNGPNCTIFEGTLVSADYNISNDATCVLTSNNDQTETDPLLRPLSDYGGPTQTHALQDGSPAVDVVPALNCVWDHDNNDATSALALTVDQRDEPRPVDGDSDGNNLCDVGAFESQGTASLVWDVDNDGTVTPLDAIFVINRLGQDVPPGDPAADIDGNGAITNADAQAVLNHLGENTP